MADSKKGTSPKSSVYQIIVQKLGSEHDDWVGGKQITDTDFPDIDFERLLTIGAVAKVREDGSVITPPVEVPAAPAPDDNPASGPHTETAISIAQIGLPGTPPPSDV